MLLVDQ
jgi:hypothetical protein